MKKLIIRGIGVLLAATALLYVGDYAALRYRIIRKLSPYDSVTVDSYYAVPEKNGKTEYDFQSSQQETCVNSLFPHLGYSPCWYARRHTDKPIPI
jgi:hypothetical protein